MQYDLVKFKFIAVTCIAVLTVVTALIIVSQLGDKPVLRQSSLIADCGGGPPPGGGGNS